MNGLKDFETIIMDASDYQVVRKIIDMIDRINDEGNGKSICHTLDRDHPSIKVLRTYTDEGTYDIMKENVECSFPGLCIFNPVIC